MTVCVCLCLGFLLSERNSGVSPVIFELVLSGLWSCGVGCGDPREYIDQLPHRAGWEPVGWGELFVNDNDIYSLNHITPSYIVKDVYC